MAVTSCKYHYDPNDQILYKVYTGPVSFECLVSSWIDAFQSGEVSPGIKRYVVDYTAATLEIKVSEYTRVARFYKENEAYFGGARIAAIVTTPRNIVVPILIETQDDGYHSKAFTTLDAARKWLLK
ncbi:hypothetical protein [Mangrovibacterium marinum]|uniref:SpoIIAA-like protein n=1 Tax=Mangrovibacterium marinum TaxID=1639118 RepID=A0A2T5C6S3_9BACT|nr:hypothetical protein [Mangrovibacterium marinum]PTN10648.1 hypothetical protein C8N47_101299 [Mangrovibacterium marinum]